MNSSSGHAVRRIDGPSSFRRSRLRADAHTTGLARSEFTQWLRDRFALTADCHSDVVLAVGEALSNAAEHAYIAAPGNGSVDVEAHFDAVCGVLTVVVEDRGRWRRRDPEAAPRRVRGRGIRLMRALADDTSIHTTTEGTRVSLTWKQFRLLPA
jgi:serine/threonine-protein kinase RsbW